MGAICGIYSPGESAASVAPVVDRMATALRARSPVLPPTENFSKISVDTCGMSMAVSHDGHWEDTRTLAVVDGEISGATSRTANADLAEFLATTRKEGNHPTPFAFPGTGYWACAAFDRTNSRIWLARDPYANKPLYYYHDPATALVVFASEPSAILAHPLVPRRINREGITAFLRFGYIPARLSAFDGIHKVFPGVALSFADDGTKQEHRFWSMPPIEPVEESLESMLPRVREHVIASVQRSWAGDDVPGLLLSGGIDSTVVLAALRELGARNIRTFTFGFDRNGQASTADLDMSRTVAQSFDTQHEEIWIDETHQPEAGVRRWLEETCEPFLTPNIYAKALLLEKAHRHGVRRCLTGTGSAYSFERRPDEFLRKLRKRAGKHTTMENWTVTRRANLFSEEEVEALTGRSCEETHQICLQILEAYAEDVRSRPWGNFGDFMFDASVRMQTGEKAGAVMERVASRCGVDMFHPLYDPDLHAFANTLPSAWKRNKQVLRSAFQKDLPTKVLERSNVGFTSPYWVGANALPQVEQAYLTEEAFARHGIISWPAAKRFLADADQRNRARKQTWGLTVLQAWLDANFSFARKT